MEHEHIVKEPGFSDKWNLIEGHSYMLSIQGLPVHKNKELAFCFGKANGKYRLYKATKDGENVEAYVAEEYHPVHWLTDGDKRYPCVKAQFIGFMDDGLDKDFVLQRLSELEEALLAAK